MSKKSILVVFGGSSFEHRISLDSAQTIINNLDREKYDISVIGITKSGKCISGDESLDLLLKESSGYTGSEDLFILRNKENTCKSFMECLESLATCPDVIFPIIHGFNGEDGRLQGMLDLIGIPYVGSGVMASAICMDKIMAKAIFEKFGIPQLPYCGFTDFDWSKNSEKVVEEIAQLGFPVFIKPANLGSSIGISKVSSKKDLKNAITEALKYDNRILAERGLIHPREIEVAVLGNKEFRTSVTGEIVIDGKYDFYTYEAKYIDAHAAQCKVPAILTNEMSSEIQNFARDACRAVNIQGLTRVDFFVDQDTQACYLNELNTIPDFTIDSMFPLLWKKSGLEYSDLLDDVIELALNK